MTRKDVTKQALAKLRLAMKSAFGITTLTARALLTQAKKYDKAYELACLIQVMKYLQRQAPRRKFMLVSGTATAGTGGGVVTFRGSGGQIPVGGTHIDIVEGGATTAEIWLDIEVLSLSGQLHHSGWSGGHLYGYGHELDLVVVKPRTTGHPAPSDLLIGVEAKHREFTKALLKEVLGVRRETAFHWGYSSPNRFAWWKNTSARNSFLESDPPSGIVLFSLDPRLHRFSPPVDFWDIHMIHFDF